MVYKYVSTWIALVLRILICYCESLLILEASEQGVSVKLCCQLPLNLWHCLLQYQLQVFLPPQGSILVCKHDGYEQRKVSRNHRNSPRYASAQIFATEICPGVYVFHLWKVVQIFQRKSTFCSKINSRGPSL